jgi:WD40 repeat protein
MLGALGTHCDNWKPPTAPDAGPPLSLPSTMLPAPPESSGLGILHLMPSANAIAISADGKTSVATTDNAYDLYQTYVFAKQSDGSWLQSVVIAFAGYVAVSGNGSIVAVADEGYRGDGSPSQVGMVHVYQLQNGSWSEVATLQSASTTADAFFAYAVAISADGHTIAAGDSNANAYETAVFSDANGNWARTATLTPSPFCPSISLSADGSTVALGCLQELPAPDASSSVGCGWNGDVYIYAQSNGVWSQQACLEPRETYVSFGQSVALSADGNELVATGVGDEAHVSMSENSRAAVDSTTAIAYVFSRVGSSWSEQIALSAAPQDSRPMSMALSADGNTIAYGTWACFTDTARIYLYQNTGTWQTVGHTDQTGGGYFVDSIALSGDGKTLVTSEGNLVLFDLSAIASGSTDAASD